MKMNSQDIYALALIYINMYSNTIQRMLSLDTLKKFEECINYNVSLLNPNLVDNNGTTMLNEQIYFGSCDEEGKVFYILRQDINVSEVKLNLLSIMSADYLMASVMDNSLDSLGLIKINDKIVLKRFYEKDSSIQKIRS